MSLAAQTRSVVEETLRAFLERRVRELGATSPGLLPTAEALRDFVLRGGKRLRPIIAVTGYVAAGGDRPLDAARLASGLELLQAYLLVHDDWMDGDTMRRGGPTVHVMLAQQHGGGALGDAAAILAGDLASALARELLLGSAPEAPVAFAAEALLEAQRAYAAFEAEVVTGQMLDLLGAGAPVPVEDLEDLKTGSYTVRGPLRLGAALAGASSALQAGLAAFGRPLGRAFQIRDDLLGLFGDPARTGKAVGRDLAAGKRTWPVDWALRNAGADADVLRRVLGVEGAGAPDVARAIAWLRDGGARAAAEARIAELAMEARTAARALSVGTERTLALEDLVTSVAERSA